MKQFWITFFGSIFGVVVGSVLTVVLAAFLIAGMLFSAAAGSRPEASTPGHGAVLELDLRAQRLDSPSRSPFAFAEPLSVVDMVRTLERAETDPGVAGIFIRANEFGLSPGMAEEVRNAIADFRASGKFVITHAQGFEGTSVTAYFAVAGSDEIWLQDTANFTPAGLASEVLFLGGMFEQFNADPQFEQFHEFKNAANVYTQTGFTDEHREATLSYMNSIFDTAIVEISRDRDILPDALRGLFETAPHSAEEALDLGLVDRLGHVIEAREAALARAGSGGHFLPIPEYRAMLSPRSNGPAIALIEGQGAIVTGSGDQGPFSNGAGIGSDIMSDAILEAANDASVRAILVRVDSPGGSAIASDQVWNAIERAQEAGKPVIISMASMAASGGYYLAAPADYILAHATTLTGSIGVLGGKVALEGTFEMVGLQSESVYVGGEYATAYSGQQSWTETQRDAFRAQMADTYEDFTQRVADGRDLPLERVLEIARGRVWTGAQALDLGLVDEIGGFRDAVDVARELAGLAPETNVRLVRFPREQTPFEAFSALFGMSAETAETAARMNALLELPEVRAAIEARSQMGSGQAQLRSTAQPPN
ncbi:signal peptide peptidase SppA [Maricaulis salignorans]|uniref:Protease-4 n=1 Tax=Maricaulis salignorans TaxID=144026 RepID=A0A1G9Q7Y7_9PROT|nr:signal peptide peptidase SppA [Maricaulis salignorans]SDM07174.1 protease-4 [Maricaulis salignorans]